MRYYIGIDLGGTNIAGGIVNQDGNIILSESVSTPIHSTAENIMDSIISITQKLISEYGLTAKDIAGMGIGCPGTVNSETGVITYCVNIPMVNVNISEYIESRTGISVNLENDANAAALGEYYMNNRDANSFILITLGTGIGGGAVLGGKIYRGFNGVGIEAGHITLVHKGEQCSCGKKGCWERYGSVTALINQTKQAMKQNPDSIMCDIVAQYGEVNGRIAFDAAKLGDKAAEKVVQQYIEYVADGIVSVINMFEPEILAIGGGISKEGDYLLEPIVEFVRNNEYNKYCPQTKLKIVSLMNDAGIIGAALSCINK